MTDREERLQYKRDWYRRNFKRIQAKQNERHRYWYGQMREEINRAKATPCMGCGIQYSSWVMQFDHRDPSIKKYTICNMKFRSLEKVREEISKCDVVCANCHAERTHRQRLSGILKRKDMSTSPHETMMRIEDVKREHGRAHVIQEVTL